MTPTKLATNAIHMAWADTRARYKKSVLGPFWITAGNAIAILGLSVVWASLLEEDIESFIPSLTIGLVVWQLIAGTIGEGPTTFTRQANLLRSIPIPHWFFVVRALSKQLINFLHNLLIVALVIIYFDTPLQWSSALSLVGFILVAANLFWITYLLGILGARFQDIEHLVTALLPLLFFLSPVIFRADRLPADLNIIWLNPLSHFIDVIRSPLISTELDYSSYGAMLIFSIAGALTTSALVKHKGRQLAFWV